MLVCIYTTTHCQGLITVKRTQILVKESQHKYLSQQAAVNNTSISEIVRNLIDEKISETNKAQSRGGVKMAESAVEGPSTPEHHDEVLYE